MRFALSTGSLYTYGLDRTFALAAEAGFDGVEVLVDYRFDTRQPSYLRLLMERYNLPILSVHAPFHPAWLQTWPQTYPASVIATADLAAAVGANLVVAHLPPLGARDYARWLLEELPAWQADHPHPVIAVENMPEKWVWWWPFASVDPWRLNRLEQWGSFSSLVLDTTHLATRGWDPLEVHARLRERVRHVHLSNARRQGRRVLEHHRLEDGFLALDLFLGQLAQDGYEGIVTLEFMPRSLGAEDEGQVRRHLRQQIMFCHHHTKTEQSE